MKCFDIKETDVDENCQNKNLCFHIVDDDIMSAIGFHHTYDFWILTERIDTISIIVKITDNYVGTIDVLDDYFCQPYDFQKMILEKGNKASQTAIEVQHKLYAILDSMKTFGILDGWEWGDYV